MGMYVSVRCFRLGEVESGEVATGVLVADVASTALVSVLLVFLQLFLMVRMVEFGVVAPSVVIRVGPRRGTGWATRSDPASAMEEEFIDVVDWLRFMVCCGPVVRWE